MNSLRTPCPEGWPTSLEAAVGKATLPFASYVVEDGLPITGQHPASAAPPWARRWPRSS